MILLKKDLSKIYTFIFLLSAILNCYDGPFGLVRLSLFILFPFCCVYFLLCMNNFKPNKKVKSIVIFSFFLVVLTLISLLYTSFSVAFVNVLGRLIILFLTIVTIYVSVRLIDKNQLVFWAKFFSFIVVSFLIIQVVWFSSTGSTVSGKLPFLTIHNEQDSDIIFESVSGLIYRPTSFFLEPSQIGLFLALTSSVILFYSDPVINKSKFTYIIMFFVGSIFSTSGTAFGLILINICIYIFFIKNKIPLFIKLFIYLFIGITSIYLYLYIEQIYVFSRFLESQNRFTTFIIFFEKLDTFQKLFGVGIGNNASYFTNYLNMDWGFVSGFGLLLLQFGFVGLLLAIILYIYVFCLLSNRCRPIFIIYLVSMTFENLLYGYWMIAFISLAFINVGYGEKNATTVVNCNSN